MSVRGKLIGAFLILLLVWFIDAAPGWFLPGRGYKVDRERCEEAIAELEAAPDEMRRYYALGSAAFAHHDLGDDTKAAALADELLVLAAERPRDWNYGNALHDGHTVRGLIAHRAGDLERAERELRLSGETPGSPQLDTFGPTMLLADRMLRAGRREAVVAYLDAVAHFWEGEDERLTSWKRTIADGRNPDWGGRLHW